MGALLDNKYRKWYFSLVESARRRSVNDVYVERHHILPKSLGGSNLKANLVDLTYREHFLAHWLLVKVTVDVDNRKMLNALFRMTHGNENLTSSWQYEVAKRAARDSKVGNFYWKNRVFSDEGRIKLSLAKKGNKDWLGKTHSAETRVKLGACNRGLKRSLATIEKIRLSRIGKKDSQATKDKKRIVLARGYIKQAAKRLDARWGLLA